MNFEKALAVELESISGLQDKVFPLYAKKGIKPPFLIYVSSEGLQDKVLDGYLESKEITCEIHVVNGNYLTVKSLTKLVLSKLLTFPGRVIGTNGLFVKSLSYDNPVEVYEKEVNFYRCSFDIKVRF